jgi:hypothetical protein
VKILLTIAYLSAQGVPQINVYERDDWAACNAEAKVWFDKLRVGSGRAWCKKIAV